MPIKLIFKNILINDKPKIYAFEQIITHHELFSGDNGTREYGYEAFSTVKISCKNGILLVRSSDDVDMVVSGDIPATAVHIETKGDCEFDKSCNLDPAIKLLISAKKIKVDCPVANANFVAFLTPNKDENTVTIKQPVSSNKLILNTSDLHLDSQLKANTALISCKFHPTKDSDLIIGELTPSTLSQGTSRHGFPQGAFESLNWKLIRTINNIARSEITFKDETSCAGALTFNYAKVTYNARVKFIADSKSCFNFVELSALGGDIENKADISGRNSVCGFLEDAQIAGKVKIDGLFFSASNISVSHTGTLDGVSKLTLKYNKILFVTGKAVSAETNLDGAYAIAAFGGVIHGEKILNTGVLSLSAQLFGGCFSGQKVLNRAAFNIGLFGLISGYYSCSDTLTGLELGNLYLPYVNLTASRHEMYQAACANLKSFSDLSSKNHNEIYHDLHELVPKTTDEAWQTIAARAGIIRAILSNISIPATTVFTFSFQTICLLKQLIRLHNMYGWSTFKDFPKQSNKEMLTILLDLKGLMVSGTALKQNALQAQATLINNPDQIPANTAPNANNSSLNKVNTLLPIVEVAATPFMPLLQTDTMADISYALRISYTDTRQNWFAARGGFAAARTIYEQTMTNQYDASNQIARNFTSSCGGTRLQAGQVDAANLAMSANRIEVATTGSLQGTQTTHFAVATDFNSRGKTNLANGSFTAGGKLQFALTSSSNTKNMHLESETLVREGPSTYEGDLRFKAKNAMSSPTGTLQSTSPDSSFGLKAETAELQAAESHEHAAFEIHQLPIPDAEDLLHGRGKFTHIKANQSLHVASKAPGNARIGNSEHGPNLARSLSIPDNITIEEDLIGEALLLQSTAGAIHQKKDVHMRGPISFEAARAIRKPGVQTESAEDGVSMQAGEEVDNSHGGRIFAPNGKTYITGNTVDSETYDRERRSEIAAQETFIHATTGNYKHRGSSTRGTKFVQVYAAGDVEANQLDYQQWHGHGNATFRLPSEILGGIGTDYSNGYGTIVQAGNVVSVYGSTIGSGAQTYVHGLHGVTFWTLGSVYKAEDRKWHSGGHVYYRKSDDVLWFPTTIFGTKNTVSSAEGPILIHGAILQAPGGNTVWCRDQQTHEHAIALLTAKDTKKRYHGIFGERSTEEVHETQHLAIFQTDSGPIESISLEQGIRSTGALYIGSPDAKPILLFRAKGDISVTPGVLNHSIIQRDYGALNATIAGQVLFGGHSQQNLVERIIAFDQTSASLLDFTKSNCPIDALINGYSTLGGVTDWANSIGQYGVIGALANHTGVTVGISNRKTVLRYQTVGNGSIVFFDQVYIISECGDVELASYVDHVYSMHVKARTFHAHGTRLDSSMRHKSYTATATASFGGIDYAGSLARSDVRSSNYAQHRMRVGIFDADIDRAIWEGSEATFDGLTGRIGTLETKSQIGNTTHRSLAVSVSRKGNVGISASSGMQETLDTDGVVRVLKPGGMQATVSRQVEYGKAGAADATGKPIELPGAVQERHNVTLLERHVGAHASFNAKQLSKNAEPHVIQFGLQTQTTRNVLQNNGMHEETNKGHRINFVQHLAPPPKLKPKEVPQQRVTFELPVNNGPAKGADDEPTLPITAPARAQLESIDYLTDPSYKSGGCNNSAANMSSQEDAPQNPQNSTNPFVSDTQDPMTRSINEFISDPVNAARRNHDEKATQSVTDWLKMAGRAFNGEQSSDVLQWQMRNRAAAPGLAREVDSVANFGPQILVGSFLQNGGERIQEVIKFGAQEAARLRLGEQTKTMQRVNNVGRFFGEEAARFSLGEPTKTGTFVNFVGAYIGSDAARLKLGYDTQTAAAFKQAYNSLVNMSNEELGKHLGNGFVDFVLFEGVTRIVAPPILPKFSGQTRNIAPMGVTKQSPAANQFAMRIPTSQPFAEPLFLLPSNPQSKPLLPLFRPTDHKGRPLKTGLRIYQEGHLIHDINPRVILPSQRDVLFKDVRFYATRMKNDGCGDLLAQGNSISGALKIEKLAQNTEQSILHQFNRNVDLTIRSPNAVAIKRGWGELSPRQANLLEHLSESGKNIIIKKNDINVYDIACLTAKTGDEFAIFTLGSRRMILRGDYKAIEIVPKLSEKLKAEQWKWSAHTHVQPGDFRPSGVGKSRKPSDRTPFGDRDVLATLDQEQSLLLDSIGRRRIFTQIDGDYIDLLPKPGVKQ